jgi:uncharacterized DUF497 family protein
MTFSWNQRKAAINLRKHAVSFTEAASVFYDPMSITYQDTDDSDDEERFVIVGISKKSRLLMISHLDDGENVRIISARTLNKTERYLYEN